MLEADTDDAGQPLIPRAIRVDPDEWAIFQRLAKNDGRTASGELRLYIRRRIAASEPQERAA